jgi:hypothetical protein
MYRLPSFLSQQSDLGFFWQTLVVHDRLPEFGIIAIIEVPHDHRVSLGRRLPRDGTEMASGGPRNDTKKRRRIFSHTHVSPQATCRNLRLGGRIKGLYMNTQWCWNQLHTFKDLKGGKEDCDLKMLTRSCMKERGLRAGVYARLCLGHVLLSCPGDCRDI